MNGRILVQLESPKTQTVEAVKSLLSYVGRSCNPMPSFVELAGGVRLTRSKKGDAYYTTTSRDCSCPARAYNPGVACKHMKTVQAAMDNASIRPKVGAFRPVSLLPSEEKVAGVA